MEEYFSTRFLTYSSDRPSSFERASITSSASVIWLWITETVQTVLLSARIFPFASMIRPLAALMLLSLSCSSLAFIV